MGCENVGIIRDATGASQRTASSDRLGYDGVRASETMANTDLQRMRAYKDMIQDVGREYSVDPALIAGIISRESRAGAALSNGWGDHGKAWGLMQVDVTPTGGGHQRRGDWNSREHLCQGTEILLTFYGRIRNKFGSWTEAQVLKGAVAAYNMGDGNVRSYDAVDARTTGGDYSNDVVARAQWYKAKLF